MDAARELAQLLQRLRELRAGRHRKLLRNRGVSPDLALGGFQGVLGWFMVASGLVNNPAVSHYRLAAHLMTAVLLYASLFRAGLMFALRPEKEAGRVAVMRGYVRACLCMVAVTMTWGAFVAGLDAGLLYNTFPLMNGYVVPPELLQHQPVWLAVFEEPASVQFTHRILAISTFCLVLFTANKSRAYHCPPRVARLFTAAALMACVQVGLGISTLLTGVNIHLAAAHQAGALTLLTLFVWLLHEIPYVHQEK